MDPNKDELNLIREWFDSVQDLNPEYLEERDYRLQVKILRSLGRRIPHDVLDGANLSGEETHATRPRV